MNNNANTLLQRIEDLLDGMPLDYAIDQAAKEIGITFTEAQDLLEAEFGFYSQI